VFVNVFSIPHCSNKYFTKIALEKSYFLEKFLKKSGKKTENSMNYIKKISKKS